MGCDPTGLLPLAPCLQDATCSDPHDEAQIRQAIQGFEAGDICGVFCRLGSGLAWRGINRAVIVMCSMENC